VRDSGLVDARNLDDVARAADLQLNLAGALAREDLGAAPRVDLVALLVKRDDLVADLQR